MNALTIITMIFGVCIAIVLFVLGYVVGLMEAKRIAHDALRKVNHDTATD